MLVQITFTEYTDLFFACSGVKYLYKLVKNYRVKLQGMFWQKGLSNSNQ